MRRSSYLVGLVFFGCLSVFGQAIVGFSSNLSKRDGVYTGSADIRVSSNLRQVVTNAPYSGERVTEHSQTLADGTHIDRPGGPHEKTWRDSQGRVRTERQMFGPWLDSEDPSPIAEISDPVAGYIYVLDSVNKVAHRVKVSTTPERSAARTLLAPLPPTGGATGAPATIGAIMTVPVGSADLARETRLRPDTTVEDLGSKMIDGVLVYGKRHTTVIPEGQQGNDRPMTTTNEIWTSKELQLMVLSVSYSPVSGTSTTKVVNLSTGEPDPALFMPPADYKLVDEEKSFQITWGEK